MSVRATIIDGNIYIYTPFEIIVFSMSGSEWFNSYEFKFPMGTAMEISGYGNNLSISSSCANTFISKVLLFTKIVT